jgi:hypothetical protein
MVHFLPFREAEMSGEYHVSDRMGEMFKWLVCLDRKPEGKRPL